MWKRLLSAIASVSSEFGVPAHIVVARSGDELSPSAACLGREPSAGGSGRRRRHRQRVAGAVVGADTALGVLPIGTLNHFAKDPGIPPGV